MKLGYYCLIFCLLFLSACESGTDSTTKQQTAEQLPLGTKIQQLSGSLGLSSVMAEYKEIAWEDLELPGQGLGDIIKKYQDQIDAIPEGDPAEEAVMKEMQVELNAAPVNPTMNGKKIKLPGFIVPLEIDDKGMVEDFLLVPYFGACIHLPPPPINQTILVKPQIGQSIDVDGVYNPFWISGMITTQKTKTDLADAGYQIEDASLDVYLDLDNEEI